MFVLRDLWAFLEPYCVEAHPCVLHSARRTGFQWCSGLDWLVGGDEKGQIQQTANFVEGDSDLDVDSFGGELVGDMRHNTDLKSAGFRRMEDAAAGMRDTVPGWVEYSHLQERSEHTVAAAAEVDGYNTPGVEADTGMAAAAGCG